MEETCRMRFMPLLGMLKLCDAFALTVTDIVSSCTMCHATVAYTDAPFTTNQRWFSRLLSWIF
jgi:hypothetical protein